MIVKPYATPADMLAWATGLMDSRDPDFIIGDNYLRRWWVIPRNQQQNVYLHEILASDSDRAMHCHPWKNTSLVIDGSYVEHTPEGSFTRVPGDVVTREATDIHRLELVGQRAVTLFFTGPIILEWGFHTENGFVYWQDFVDPENPGRTR